MSESTVVRFASVLGYEGYPQLQRALQELVSHRLTAVQRFEMSSEIDPDEVLRTVLKSDMQNIRATVEQLDVQRLRRCGASHSERGGNLRNGSSLRRTAGAVSGLLPKLYLRPRASGVQRRNGRV